MLKSISWLKPKKLSFYEKTNRAGLYFVIPFLLVFIVFNIYPILHSLRLSFFEWNGLSPMEPVGLGNYVRLFTSDPYFLKSVGNTLYVLVLYLPFTMLISLILASLLNHKLVKGKSLFQTAWFLPFIVAPVSIGYLFRVLFDWSTGAVNGILLNIGIINEGLNWLGSPKLAPLVLAFLMFWSFFGYITTLFLAGMTSIPAEIIEAAEVDGANYFQKLFKIIVPMLKPVLVFVSITQTIICLQLYDAAKVLVNPGMVGGAIGGPGRSVLTAIWYMVDTSMGGSTGMPRMGYAAAITYGLFIITVIFSILNYKIISSKEDSYE